MSRNADEEVTSTSDYIWPLAILIIVVSAALILFFVFLNQGDAATAGRYVPGDNCTLLTCPAGPIGPPGVGIPGPPGARGERGEQGIQGLQVSFRNEHFINGHFINEHFIF